MGEDVRVRISENGRLVIPSSFRKALKISCGGEVLLQLDEDGIRITTTALRIARAQRIVRKYIKPGVSLVDELLAERRAEARKELNE